MSAISDLFDNFEKQLVSDVKNNAAGLLAAFFSNVKANPTSQNVAAQGAILAASALLQLPNLEAQAISQFADTGLAAIQLLNTPKV